MGPVTADKETTQIGVVGLWHLGCVLSAAWSKLGFSVRAFDYDEGLIARLSEGRPPLFEPELPETIAQSMGQGRLTFSHRLEDLRVCDYVFLAYDTPVLDNDDSDLRPLEKAVFDLGRVLHEGAVVIVSSQSPVGWCGKARATLQKRDSTLEVVYSPENLRLGQAIACYLRPGRIVVGADSDRARDKATALFGHIEANIVAMSLASAEMVKHGINAFLANSIVFVNHLADLCEATEADVRDVVRGMKTDERIGSKAYLSPGIGFSGGTLGRDLRVLARLNRRYRKKARLYESLHRFNAERKGVIAGRIFSLLEGTPSRQTVAVLGLTYKPGTSTLRRSLPLEIVQRLGEQGMHVKVFDPKADYGELDTRPPFEVCTSIEQAIEGVDLIVLLTEWPQFRQYDWQAAVRLPARPRFFDTKNFLADQRLGEKGYEYVGVGCAS